MAKNVPGVFQTARVSAEIPVGGAQEVTEIRERHGPVYGQGAHNAEADPLVNETIQLQRAGFEPLPRDTSQDRRAVRTGRVPPADGFSLSPHVSSR
jgi:D-ribose pyranose/furanose isomerase RbsD